MASSLALKKLLSSSLISTSPRLPRTIINGVAPSSSRLFNTSSVRDDAGFFSDIFDPFSPTGSLSQVLNLFIGAAAGTRATAGLRRRLGAGDTEETTKGIYYRGNHISFGRYALQALEPTWITSTQVEAGRRAMARNARGGKIWVRIFPDKPVTVKPVGTRMGKGKGCLKHLVAVVEPGRILYEMEGVGEKIARKAIAIAAAKLPVRTRLISV